MFLVIIDRVDESGAFIHFVGMPIAPCFLRLDYMDGVGKPHINIRWSDDGSDENERVYRYRLDCGLIVSARGTPQPSENPPRDFK